MIKIRRFVLLFTVILLALSIASGAQAQVSNAVYVITIKGVINPTLVDYVKRGINLAEDNNAQALVIQMDTPGGLDTAMRDIVQLMVNARVPVVVYVSPSGARAASAGVFITMAAHVAAMAPNTAIGAAHPVSIGGDQTQTTPTSAEDEKVLNDAAAYIRSLAASHGRNVDWAEKAVRESVSATEQEALTLGVIDMIAPDLPALLNQLDGRQVTLISGQQVTLHTKGAVVITTPMKTIEKFLYTITDPNIAYILMSVATLGIMAELFNPGLIFPGIIGGICLLLSFYSLGVLPVNYAGLGLILLALGLFVGEFFSTSYGVLTIGGLASLVAGSLMLFKGSSPVFRVSPWLIAVVCLLIAGFLSFIIQRAVKAHRQQAYFGREELLNKTAVVRAALNPEGVVFYKGERWQAVSESGAIPEGEEVTIKTIDGLTLHVVKKEAPPPEKKK
jgi:membrane-bound serine protease (ClpP class)